jgi:hypothetical protein
VKQAKLLLEVVAGIIPQQPMPEYTQKFAITCEEWADAEANGDTSSLLAQANGRAQGYAGLLMLQPDRVNWVQTTWLWL